jgi:hypothetical protein
MSVDLAGCDEIQSVGKGHDRIEVRECWSTSHPDYLNLIRGVQNWVGLCSIAMAVCTRIIDGKQTREVRFYISSCPERVHAGDANTGPSK